MSYYNEEVSKINYYGIKYREIKDINDYVILEREVDNLVANGNKRQLLISSINLKNKAIEEKDNKLSVHLPLVSSMLFGIGASALTLFNINGNSLWNFIKGYGLSIIVYFIIVCIMLKKAEIILKVCNKKIVFYDTICEMIKNR